METSTITSPAVSALALHDAGLCIIRASQDGSKTPLGNWKKYQMGRPKRGEIWSWFQDWHGVGLVTGLVSGGAEILDFDDHRVYQDYLERLRYAGLDALISRIQKGYEERTPNGAHLLYRVKWEGQPPDGNTKLAQHRIGENIKAIIETRGEGGFCIIAPSSGTVHRSGKPYELSQGGPSTITTITRAERDELFAVARSFHTTPRPEVSEISAGSTPSSEYQDSPGTRFAELTTWADILEPAGWVALWNTQGTQGWRRPGKDTGMSATTNYAGSDLFYPFTTSTIFDAERGYNKFAVHTFLHHNGDFSAAAKTLVSEKILSLNIDRKKGSSLKMVTTETQNTVIDDAASEAPPPPRNFTDLGNTERLLDLHGEDIRYCHAWRAWLLWNGRHWQRDQDGGILRLAVNTVENMYTQAAAGPEDKKGPLTHFAIKSEDARRLHAMVGLAQNFRPISTEALDGHDWKLTTSNGMLDLKSHTFAQDGIRKDYLTRAIPVPYEPEATCPRWEQFLSEIFAEDTDLIEFIQKAIGYTLQGGNQERCFFLMHGQGANGKSKFLGVLSALFGEFGSNTAFTTFLDRDRDVIRNDLAALQGVRFVAAAETKAGRSFDEAVIKNVTGGDPISARFMRAEYFQYQPQFKIWLATNNKPTIRGSDQAIWERLHLIPFNVTFDRESRDSDLLDKLLTELPGVLKWAVAGCDKWQAEGLRPPSAIAAALTEYQTEMDTIGQFLDDETQRGEGYQVCASDLYVGYRDWCHREGYAPESQNSFGRALTEQGLPLVPGRTRRMRAGIRLTGQLASPAPF